MMSVVVLAVARAVPLLFYLSFLLVAGRYLHDRIAASSRAAAGVVVVLLAVVGAAAAALPVARSGASVLAQHAAVRGEWASVDRWLGRVDGLGGSLSASQRRSWIEALMALRRWQEAETLLVRELGPAAAGVGEAPTRLVIMLGLCRYHQGRLAEAERTLAPVSEGPDAYLRDYVLGRVAHRLGRLDRAETRYRQSLAARPRFYPALYQAVAVLLVEQRFDAAGELVDRYLESVPAAAGTAQVEELRAAIRERRTGIPEREFFIVFA